MSAASRKLFKEMVAEAARMPDFNYRSYFLRWTNLFVFLNKYSLVIGILINHRKSNHF